MPQCISSSLALAVCLAMKN